MVDMSVVDLSRLQFAMTALYHFLFVPLTLGLSLLMAIMESVYVMTGRQIWRDMVKFWGILFSINFAMGVATGVVMEFQFGMNWSYYSLYVGDIFGAPLAIEGLMAFFLEATFIGLFFFGWDRMSKYSHLLVTWLVALGANFSALWILVANGWMQNPVGAEFNPETMRMELVNFFDVIFNDVAQAKFVHTVSAGYVTGAMFVLGVSGFYMLRGRHVGFARRSMTVAASFGLAASLSVVVLGDESGYLASEHQHMKLAAIEGMWETEPAPAPFNLVGWPSREDRETHMEVQIPWLLGLIGTRSLDTQLPGINELVERAEERIRAGIPAVAALERLRRNPDDQTARAELEAGQDDLGYAFLLKPYTEDVTQATDAQVAAAAFDTVPDVFTLFWAFRGMVALGFYFIVLFAIGFWLASTRRLERTRWFQRLALYSIPLPFLAAELGWIVAEYGRQPWAIEGILPTSLAASGLAHGDALFTLAGFILLYSTLWIIEVYLLVKYVRRGPAQPHAPAGDHDTRPAFGGAVPVGGDD